MDFTGDSYMSGYINGMWYTRFRQLFVYTRRTFFDLYIRKELQHKLVIGGNDNHYNDDYYHDDNDYYHDENDNNECSKSKEKNEPHET